MKKISALVLSLILAVSAVFTCFSMNVSAAERQADAYAPTCYQQTDSRWANKQDIGPSGCGLISLVNAVHYLTGNFIDPEPLAIYAHEIDAYNGSVGGGTARWVLYHQLQSFEKKYGFKVTLTGTDANVKDSRLIKHLKEGGVSVAHVYGHFIAICGYNEKDKTYLIYDCAANSDRRGTTTNGDWMTVKELTTMQYMTVDWFCLLKATTESQNINADGKVFENAEAQGYIRTNKAGLTDLRITGSAYSDRGIKSIYYTVDYNFDTVYTFIETVENGENSVAYDQTIDLSGVKRMSYGEHFVRLTAETLDGGVCDIAEYKISINNGDVVYDAERGKFELGFSGFNGQPCVVSKFSQLKNGSKYAFKHESYNVLDLGILDLSKYETAVISYSVRNGFKSYSDTDQPHVIGLRSDKCTFGVRTEGIRTDGSLAYGAVENGDGDGLAVAREVVLDLSRTDYCGKVFLATNIDNIVGVRGITFYEPAKEETTDAETTVEETTSDETTAGEAEISEAGTEDTNVYATQKQAETHSEETETTVDSTNLGCVGSVCALPLFAVAACALILRKGRKDE